MYRGALAIFTLIFWISFGSLQCCLSWNGWLRNTGKSIKSFVFGEPGFVHNSCKQLKLAYAARIGGQDEHLASIAETICRHTKSEYHEKPLVLLLTGPPGVGKTWTTRVTAQALFTTEPILPTRCDPTRGACAPFLQISSYSYTSSTRPERYDQLKHRIKDHVQKMPQSLIVFEDFDRLDCSLRDYIRDMIEYGAAHELHWTDSIIILTSNAGATRASQIAKDRSQDQRAWAEHQVQRLVEDEWSALCKTSSSSEHDAILQMARMIKLVDRFLAFNALSPQHIQAVFQKRLEEENKVRENRKYAYSLPLHQRLALVWDDSVTSYLATREILGGYSGGFSKQGASKCSEAIKQVLTLLEDANCSEDSLEQQLRIRKAFQDGSAALDLTVSCEARLVAIDGPVHSEI